MNNRQQFLIKGGTCGHVPSCKLGWNETTPFGVYYLECQTVHMYMVDATCAVSQSRGSSTIMVVGHEV